MGSDIYSHLPTTPAVQAIEHSTLAQTINP